LGVVSAQFARQIAPIPGFRNILVHEYLKVDWDHVYAHLQSLNELGCFGSLVRRWLAQKMT
jgi:uncharacterized protein YutE (UPF0331/DUF86 family)